MFYTHSANSLATLYDKLSWIALQKSAPSLFKHFFQFIQWFPISLFVNIALTKFHVLEYKTSRRFWSYSNVHKIFCGLLNWVSMKIYRHQWKNIKCFFTTMSRDNIQDTLILFDSQDRDWSFSYCGSCNFCLLNMWSCTPTTDYLISFQMFWNILFHQNI